MRYFTAALIVLATITTYIIMLVQQATFQSLVSTANIAMHAATANATPYAATFAIVESSPLWIWALPAIVGGILVLMTLKAGKSQTYY